MIQPALAVLGRTNSGGPVGYRIIDVHGNVVKPFTRAGVVETSLPGCYRIDGGIDLPPEFAGYITWSVAGGNDIATGEILPQPALDLTDLARRLDAVAAGLARVTNEASAVGEMARSGNDQVAELLSAQADNLAFIKNWCDQTADYARLSHEMSALQSRLDRLGGVSTPTARLSPLGDAERAAYESKISALQNKVNHAVTAIDKFLVQAELRAELGGR